MFGGGKTSIPGVSYDIQRIYDHLTPKPKELIQNAHKRRFIKYVLMPTNEDLIS
jgi:hypothetical protein